MLTKTAFGLALVIATVSGSLAATKPHAAAPAASAQTVNNPSGATDPDRAIRFDLNRDATHGRY